MFEEDVLRLEISVEDLLLVEVEKSECHLCKPVEDLIFGEVLAFLVLNTVVHVTAFTVDHNDVQELLSVHVAVFVCNDVRVTQLL